MAMMATTSRSTRHRSISLRAHTGHYISITDEKNTALAEKDDKWERFEFVDPHHLDQICSTPSDGQIVALRSCQFRTCYLSAWDSGEIVVASHCEEWEHFSIEQVGDKIALRTYHGTYVSVNNDNTLSTAPHNKSWEQFCMVKYQVIHTFDLGGGGLKYCAWHCNVEKNNYDRQTEVARLGTCDVSKSPAQWLREKIPSISDECVKSYLDQCVNQDGAAVGFSMAGLDKLWNDRIDRSDCRSVATLFELDPSCVSATGDGAAHMIGARHFLESQLKCNIKHPHINFALGTGVGMGASNSKGESRGGTELVFDVRGERKAAWSLVHPSTGRKAWDVLGRNGVGLGPAKFAEHWREFYDQVWIKLYSEKNWTEPTTISFTGGCLRMDGIASALNAKFPECHECQFFNEESGNAGLLGAAVLILKKLLG